MRKFDLIVIGWGKAGKTIAKKAATKGHKVAMIEQKPTMYGGTCINIACIPTKTIRHEAYAGHSLTESLARRNEVVGALNKKNYQALATEDNVTIYDATAEFISNDAIRLLDEQGALIEEITATNIVINTGAVPNVIPIPGLATSHRVYDSTGIQFIKQLPEHLTIIGAGPIGLEFATIFNQLGSRVTVIDNSPEILPQFEPEVRAVVVEDLKAVGIELLSDTRTEEISDEADYTLIKTSKGDVKTQAILLSAGRKPNTAALALNNTDIQTTDRGAIVVNEYLETTVPGIYAAGDVKGGLQFTYISLDDSRIILDHLYGNKLRTTHNRGVVPTATFITPPLAEVGLTEAAAKQAGHEVKTNLLPVNQIPKHKIIQEARGLWKVVVDANNDQILGATLYGPSAEELINLIKLAIDQSLTYQALRDAIYTHPTMTEGFNDLFNL